MSTEFKVCRFDQLTDNKGYPVNVDDYEVALFRVGKDVFALEDCCSHQDFPLNGAAVMQDRIKCRAHGAEFCLKTGKALCTPAFAPVQVFKVTVRNGDVYVAIE